MTLNLTRRWAFTPIFALSLALVGCGQSTDVSQAPSEAEMQAATKTRTAAVQERNDLTPEQKANLMKYQSGGGAPASGPGK